MSESSLLLFFTAIFKVTLSSPWGGKEVFVQLKNLVVLVDAFDVDASKDKFVVGVADVVAKRMLTLLVVD